MPITSSAKKALRSSRKKAAGNAKIRNIYKDLLKRARKNPSSENITKAFTFIDKAGRTNIIHKNKASRLKSRLAKLIKKVTPKKEVIKPARKKAVRKTKKKA